MHHLRQLCRSIFILPVLAVLLTTVSVEAAGITASLLPAVAVTDTLPAENEPLNSKPDTLPVTIPNLVIYTTGLSEKITDLQSRLAKINSYEEEQQELSRIQKNLESLKWEAKMQEADSNLTFKQLNDTLNALDKTRGELTALAAPLQETAQFLNEQQQYWTREQQNLADWVETLKDSDNFSLFQTHVNKLQDSIASALTAIETKMVTTLEILHNTADVQIKLYNLKVQLDDILAELRQSGFEQTSPPLFSRKFYARVHAGTLQAAWHNMTVQLAKAYHVTTDNLLILLLIFCVPACISAFFYRNLARLRQHPNWSLLTDCPLGFSVFSFLIFVIPFMPTTQALMLPVLSIALIFSVMRLAGKFKQHSIWITRFIYALSFFLVLNILTQLFKLPLPLLRIYILVTCLAWLAYFSWRIRMLQGREHRILRTALWAISLSLVVIIATTVAGYDSFAQYLFKGIFTSIFLFISSVILFYTTRILLELFLTLLPVIRRHASVIISSLQPFVFFICILLYYSSFATIWQLFPTSRDAVHALTTFGIPLGNYTLTIQTIFVSVGIIYGAFLISRAVQSIMLQEIMPRYNIDKGVQLSIARLVHYTIIILGCIVLLQVMGVSLTKLTILGGALGVGIGFGLQTIVNNFASGLILLFERPIKVGDTIELDTEMGEVKHLGLRSTIIKTFDNAEIVVPNSDLVSTQVTNWTLAERKARVKVPIGVAYGSDLSKVFEILLAVAEEHPMTLTTPEPRALFLAFGDSSLDFELRVWVADFNDRRSVLSELNQEINNEFADAGIEIPFPQTDLHLRTVDDEAVQSIRTARRPDTPESREPQQA